jgi:hypothetical protein
MNERFLIRKSFLKGDSKLGGGTMSSGGSGG